MLMHNETIEQLRRLRAIEPDPGFVRRSRNMVLSSAPAQVVRPWWSIAPVFRFAGAAIVVGIGLMSASTMLFPPKPVLSSSLNSDSLRNEILNTIAIQVKEISYDQVSHDTITSAIDEIRNTNASHMNPTTLKNEMDGIDLGDTSTSTVDDLLNQVMQ
jgi:hypothetical protein